MGLTSNGLNCYAMLCQKYITTVDEYAQYIYIYIKPIDDNMVCEPKSSGKPGQTDG